MTPLVLDLPFPPSMNRIWRIARGKVGRRKPQVYLNPRYVAWKRECDAELMISRLGLRKDVPIRVPMKLTLTLDGGTKRTGDTDNRIKPVQDWLQRAGVIWDDKLIRDVRAHWGDAKRGCRVTLEALQ
jgi:Holliday junction resolvase RusA-like endonuclease